MKTLIIIGESEYSRMVAKIAKRRFKEIVFFDIDSTEDYGKYAGNSFFVASTDNRIRRFVCVDLIQKYCRLVSIVSPKAFLSGSAIIGTNMIIMNGAIINDDVIIGNGVIIDTDCSIGCRCTIGDYSAIFSGANLGCNVEIGRNVIINSGARVADNVKIADNVIVAPGAVVTKDIIMPGTYEGLPSNKVPDVRQVINRKYKS